MRFNLFTTSLAIMFIVSCTVFKSNNSTHLNFQNELLMKGLLGTIIEIKQDNNECKTGKTSLVKWENGYVSYGIIENEIPIGLWKTFDKKLRLRKDVFFGDRDYLLQIIKYDKYGNVIYRSTSITF
jgi:hypothetical protein